MINKYNAIILKVWKNLWPWLIIAGIWETLFVFNLGNSAFLASPLNILSSFVNASFLQILIIDLFSTLSRFSLALLFAYLISLVVIYVSFLFPFFYNLISQINNVLKYLPAPVVIPIAILSFGLTDLAKTSVVTFTMFVLYLSFCINIFSKDYEEYKVLASSWKLNANQKFWYFFLPQSNFLSFRILPQIVLWGMATAILTELILGGSAGLGVRLLLFQQLYNTSFLYAYLVAILVISYTMEKTLVNLFSRYKYDLIKILSLICVVVIMFFSVLSQSFEVANNIRNSNVVKIVSYKGVVNLPLLVYAKKFNRLNANIEFLGTGLQAMDALQSGNATIGGYSDMPNALQALQGNSSLKLVSQLTETQDNPALFLVAKTPLDSNNLSSLNGSTIAYFPNNPVIQQGLDFVLFTKKVNTNTIKYTSTNDPNALVQALIAGKIDALVSFEPYITDVEEQLKTVRINDKTLISTISFQNLPLAGLVINKDKLVGQERIDFLEDMSKSLDFIRQNTDSNYFPSEELKTILKENNLNPNSRIPEWQTFNEVKTKDLEQLVLILKTYGVEGFDNLDTAKLEDYYIN